jgi:hypothetical protein
MQKANLSHFEHDHVKIHTSMWGGRKKENKKGKMGGGEEIPTSQYWDYYTNDSISVLLMFSQEYLRYKCRTENHDHDISFLLH